MRHLSYLSTLYFSASVSTNWALTTFLVCLFVLFYHFKYIFSIIKAYNSFMTPSSAQTHCRSRCKPVKVFFILLWYILLGHQLLILLVDSSHITLLPVLWFCLIHSISLYLLFLNWSGNSTLSLLSQLPWPLTMDIPVSILAIHTSCVGHGIADVCIANITIWR